MTEILKTTCRSCAAFCPVIVTREQDRISKVEGNPNAPLYQGFICPKGRALATLHNDSNRLRHHLKRQPDGSFTSISSEQLVDEISEKLEHIMAQHGPISVASYIGTPVNEQPALYALMNSFMRAIGSKSFYTHTTLDQPGVPVADALHGKWAGGNPNPDDLDVLLLVGTNPIISKQYFGQDPGKTIKTLVKHGTKLIVIDPRRTETSRHAHLFLQCVPGEDPTIIAGLIHLIIENGAVNQSFVEINAVGLNELKQAVALFTPDYVAERAGVSEDDLKEAARLLGEANKGDIYPGVGPSMATRGNLTTYLCRCLKTLRGHWPAEGEQVTKPGVLLPAMEYKAQPIAPYPAWGFGMQLRARGLQQTAAGMPAAALPEEILTPGEGQVRALFSYAGLMSTWPDAELAKRALESLDLLIVHDYEGALSPTARIADYVVALRLPFETPFMTQTGDAVGAGHPGYGWNEPYAAYHPAIVEPPADADVLDSWQLYYRVAQKLGLPMKCIGLYEKPATAPDFDMAHEPTTDELYELMCRNAKVPLAEVRKYPDGHLFNQARAVIGPRDPDCDARLELANRAMMNELRTVHAESTPARRGPDNDHPFLLIPRRMQNVTNSLVRTEGLLKVPYNPAYLHASDLEKLGLSEGDRVEISSRHGMIEGFVGIDNNLRPGVLSMCHGFGRNPGDLDYDPAKHGSNVNELISWNDDYDPYHGMPRMSALPISIMPAGRHEERAAATTNHAGRTEHPRPATLGTTDQSTT